VCVSCFCACMRFVLSVFLHYRCLKFIKRKSNRGTWSTESRFELQQLFKRQTEFISRRCPICILDPNKNEEEEGIGCQDLMRHVQMLSLTFISTVQFAKTKNQYQTVSVEIPLTVRGNSTVGSP